jgi:hypothetical protein
VHPPRRRRVAFDPGAPTAEAGSESALDDVGEGRHAWSMANKVDHMFEEALALSAEERATLAAKLLASLPSHAVRPTRRWLDLAGRGVGVWGDNSTATLEKQRDEWH